MVDWTPEQIAAVLAATIKRLRYRLPYTDIDDLRSAAGEGVTVASKLFDETRVSGDPLSVLKHFAYRRALDSLRGDKILFWKKTPDGTKILAPRPHATNHDGFEDRAAKTNEIDLLDAETFLSWLKPWERGFILDCMDRSLRDIANDTNISYETVRTMKTKIINKIKRKLS